MISSGTHSSTERITRFMNSVYVNTPRSVSLFSFNFRQQTERSTIRGICIGTNGRRSRTPQKNVVVVSGLPLQDPSLIGVGLYIAAVLSRREPSLPHDVSVIPLAHPKEYESRWRSPRFSESRATHNSRSLLPEQQASNFVHENVTLELKDTCKPIEVYITRKNKYFVNVDMNISTHGASMQYKGNSLAQLSAQGKHRDFFSEHSPLSVPLPPSLAGPSRSLIPEQADPFIAPLVESPTMVVELKGTQPLDDEQVVARGEEVITMIRKLFESE
jgi:hypothetical protein